MDYIEFLSRVHTCLQPNNYFEVGCRFGDSLRLASCSSIAVDPRPELTGDLLSRTKLYAETSDAFFARVDRASLLSGPIDLAYIDGMHHAEFVLRDFANIEDCSHAGGVIVIDDVLPMQMVYADRERSTQIWCGDVYRIVPLLRLLRPDLRVEVFDIEMKGACVVWRLAPGCGFDASAVSKIESDLRGGAYRQSAVDEIRRVAAPRPIADLDEVLFELKCFRRSILQAGQSCE